ncbi:uncharacterized protein LOC62_07G009580 [Vanrija pseudolonga]|uniref:Uncharacterized protein n=1 Tax=Vanrija pseudolonga TaxID=143232 RepID=A0AAF0YK04_9TREE|nr:hypothetical protein LOC62_07G009580 [Vanrija pseudolonga]
MASNRPQRNDNSLDRLVRGFIAAARPHIEGLMGANFPEAELRTALRGIPTAEQRAGAVRNYVERIVSQDELNQLLDQLVLQEAQPPAGVFEAARTMLPGSSTKVGDWQVFTLGPGTGAAMAGRVVLLLPEHERNALTAPAADSPTIVWLDPEVAATVDITALHRDLERYMADQPISSVTGCNEAPATFITPAASGAPPATVVQRPYMPPSVTFAPHTAPQSTLAPVLHPTHVEAQSQPQGILAAPLAGVGSDSTISPISTGFVDDFTFTLPAPDAFLPGTRIPAHSSAVPVPAPLYPQPLAPLQIPAPSSAMMQAPYSAPAAQPAFWAPIPRPPIQFPNLPSTTGRQTPVPATAVAAATPTPIGMFVPNIPVGGRLQTRSSLLQLEGFGPATRTFSQASQGDVQGAQNDAERRAKQPRLN